MLNVALVGAGGMARNYRGVYAKLPGVRWALAVDVNPAELEKCRELGVQRVSSRFEDGLADGIDVVDISTPNHLHEPQAVAALAAGKHVLLQKPLANTLDAGRHIVEAASRARGKLGVYMSSYTEPVSWEIKRIIDAGLLGSVHMVRARFAWTAGLQFTDTGAWRASRDKTGGGAFIQLSTHCINLMHWWLGQRITDVAAFSDNRYSRAIGGDDMTVAAVRFADGAMGVFEAGYASEGFAREIYGTRGSLRWAPRENLVEMTLHGPYSGEHLKYSTPGKPARLTYTSPALDDAANPLNQQRMFLQCVADGGQPHMSGAAALADLAVVMAIYESAKRREFVRVA